MPTFHIQVAGKSQGPDGQLIDVAPRIALQQRGPVIQVSVGLDQGMVKALVQQGRPIPETRSGLALIDTGASVTCIDERIAQELNLPVVDVGKMMSASHSAHPSNIYPISLTMPQGVSFSAPRAMGANLAPQGLVAIIGRDILAVCTMFYNGIAGQITLSL